MLIRNRSIAKHLEPLKGGKIPLEILVRGKDAEQNSKHWQKCLEVIKTAGVCEAQGISHSERLTLE